ncbi:hypothetical protein [Polymorphum gilvum]|uniref:hypothetical protein n=1 Tax=Polymorphum gilvum TaxID=991904 RepID=UPI0002DEE13D|nr:hypothetical protein [Polymorphum gilvum]
MKEISKNFEAYASFGILVLGLLYIPLVVVVASKAHAASPALPRCDEARTIDRVRGALEAQSGKVILGLHSAVETHVTDGTDYRRCMATVVTDGDEATVSYAIGWYDRENAVPFWAGDGLPRSQ